MATSIDYAFQINVATGDIEYLKVGGDFPLRNAEPIGVSACKVEVERPIDFGVYNGTARRRVERRPIELIVREQEVAFLRQMMGQQVPALGDAPPTFAVEDSEVEDSVGDAVEVDSIGEEVDDIIYRERVRRFFHGDA